MAKVFPDRKGYISYWTRACEVKLVPLDALSPGQVPKGQPLLSDQKMLWLDDLDLPKP